jgi:hypothetical protein
MSGRGFIQVNTPKELRYTEGLVMTLRDLEAMRPESRASIVELPAYVKKCREGFADAIRVLELSPLIDDMEDDVELPRVKAYVPPKEKLQSIAIVSKHFESGNCTFEIKDYDGVLDDGVVPMIVKDDEDRKKEEEASRYTVYPWTMTDEERAGYERLFVLWKTKSTSNSRSGDIHRQASGRMLPDGSEVGRPRKRSRLDATTAPTEDAVDVGDADVEDEFYGLDDIALAIKLAEDVLR